MGHGQHDRAVALRRQHRLRRRRRPPPRRHAALSLQDDRPRPDLEAARRRAAAGRLPARRARGSGEARTALPRHRARRDVLDRRRADLAAAAAEPADRGGARSAWSRTTTSSSARTADRSGSSTTCSRSASTDRQIARDAAAPVRAGRRDAVALRIGELGHARRLSQSAARRVDLLLAEGRREGRAEDRDPRRAQPRGADAEQHAARADGQRRQRGPRRFQERGAAARRRGPARGLGPALRGRRARSRTARIDTGDPDERTARAARAPTPCG